MITFQQSYQQRVGEGRLYVAMPDAQVYRAYKGNKCLMDANASYQTYSRCQMCAG